MNLLKVSISVLEDAKCYLQKISAAEYSQSIPLSFDFSMPLPEHFGFAPSTILPLKLEVQH